MAMRFRHLKVTSKQAVGVFRSDIHGRGLFCLRDIEAGEMVIEYAGEVFISYLNQFNFEKNNLEHLKKIISFYQAVFKLTTCICFKTFKLAKLPEMSFWPSPVRFSHLFKE